MPRKPLEFVNHPLSFEAARSQGSYRAFCHHVVDGDTFDASVDVGLFEYPYRPFRLRGYDAWELHRATEYQQALRDTEGLKGILESAYLRIVTFRDAMTFDRYVADVFVVSDSNESEIGVVAWLREHGYGKV